MQASHFRRLLRASTTFFIVATVAAGLAASARPARIHRAVLPASVTGLPAQTGQATSSSMRLAELLFDPRPGDTAFVEILNSGIAPAYLDSLLLRIDTLTL